MGGEHHVSFHDNNRDPCSYIHRKRKEVLETEVDRDSWPEVKTNILQFMNEYSDNKSVKKYIIQIESWDNPRDIDLFWHRNDDPTDVGKVMHDVVKLLMLAYPGKICACFDRCDIYEEFPDNDYNMCKFAYGTYYKLPKFALYKPNEEDLPNPDHRKKEIKRLKEKIKQLKKRILELER